MYRLLALALALLPYPTVGWAEDGGLVASYSSGAWSVEERFLCDGDHTAIDCAEIDLHSETSGGLPEHAQLDLSRTTGCAGAVTVAVRGLPDILGLPGTIGTISLAGTSSLPLPSTFRYVDGVPGTAAGCTDLEVILRLFYPPSRGPRDFWWLY